MPTSAWDKFLLLSWKNWMIQLRHPIQTFFEFFAPIFICALLILVRGLADVETYNENTKYQPQSTTILGHESWLKSVNRQLIYSPENDVFGNIVQNVSEQLGFSLPVVGCANAEELLNKAVTLQPYASIEFEDSQKSVKEIPMIINYSLRFPAETRKNATTALLLNDNWSTNFKHSRNSVVGPRNPFNDDGGEPPGYISQGFIALQNAIEQQIIYETNQTLELNEIPELYIQRFPYPPYTGDIIGRTLEFSFPFVFLIAFLYNCINNIKYITTEKELQLKEVMKIMGLPSYMHWIAWFTKCMIFQILIVSILTGMLKIQLSNGLAVFTHANWLIVWLFLVLYSMAAVTYTFMISTFFNKANVASIVGSVIWFLLLLPYTLINENTPFTSKLVASALCNTGMAYGFKVINQYEIEGTGVQWSNLFLPISIDEDLRLGGIMVVLLMASVIQMLVALYVEKVRPGEFGVAEPFYFPFTIKCWTGKVSTKEVDLGFVYENNSKFEAEPKRQVAGIQVRGLRKVYCKKIAVKNLSLNIYENQITVLLGHNGAGKSTTMSMLTGLHQPTSGTAFIDGKDIRTNMDSIRSSFGMCPQQNVLFNELTVKEHITFFSKLKGMKKRNEIDEQIRKYVSLLELTPKLNALSCTLSGGMKRKLSIGIALCGNSKIVMCDEPTSGMDPAARRALWDVLIQEKKGRTILLTTHFMDEADVLGDRIAIMADGELKTVGSSFFLKKKFGIGYRLVCVKAPGCDKKKITNLLTNYIPEISIETNIGSELTYVLKEEYISKFKTIFADLETKSTELKIDSFGVSLTTLEEVFLKVGADACASLSSSTDIFESKNVDYNKYRYDDEQVGKSTESVITENREFVCGPQLLWNQTIAMIMKKFLYFIRNYFLLFLQFFIPILFIIITVMWHRAHKRQKLPTLPISFSEYEETVTTVEKDAIESGSFLETVATSYESIINSLADGHTLQITTKDFQEEILEKYKKPRDVNSKYMIGVTFNASRITAWFNNQAYHTAPLAINTINNAILKIASGNASRAINLFNKPLNYSKESQIAQMSDQQRSMGFKMAFDICFAMSFVTAMFVVFYIKERVSRAKLLQFVCGVNKFIFWLTSFTIDYVLFVLISLCFTGVLATYDLDGYNKIEQLKTNFELIVLFGFAVFPITYICSFMFQIPSTGLVKLSVSYTISGVFTFMIYIILNDEALGLHNVAELLGRIFLIFPHYSLARGMYNLYLKQETKKFCEEQCTSHSLCNFTAIETICDVLSKNEGKLETELYKLPEWQKLSEKVRGLIKLCCERDDYAFNEKGVGTQFLALGLLGVFSFVILFAIEYKWIHKMYFKCIPQKRFFNIPESEDEVIDSDVLVEKNRIRSITDPSQDTLVVKDLTKFYGKMLAVNQICVSVKNSECFGLLGINGAGKTSTFKMLTGDSRISSGEAWVDGISIKRNIRKIHHKIGYCPQFDALFDDLTGRETLKIFALLRGIPRNEINAISIQFAEEFAFTKHLDKKVSAYSGGNKRKLSAALSLMGNPSVVYLDEPTSGMDVGARRQLWNMIIKARNAGKSVVLTSHSMEECEVLCTRLAIMVNGEFKCLGPTQHLKNKFSKGFFLTIKIERASSCDSLNDPVAEVKNFVTSTFSTAILKEEYMDMVTYHIPTAEVKWSQLFGLMEDAKKRLNISDYSLGQTSLEQVFLFFTKYQRISD